MLGVVDVVCRARALHTEHVMVHITHSQAQRNAFIFPYILIINDKNILSSEKFGETKQMFKILVLTKKINEILKFKKLSCNKLSKLVDYKNSSFDEMIKGKRPFPEKIIKKLLPILEVSREEFESWIVADKYPKEVLILAIQIKNGHSSLDEESNQTCKTLKQVQGDNKRKSILTTKIDTILQEKDMSRTALAKQIKYSQSSINAMIVGKINMSKSVIERVSNALEIPQIEIQSWIIADKYSLDVLERAWGLV
jgi:plasmid maintenance system antidote protein VapI